MAAAAYMTLGKGMVASYALSHPLDYAAGNVHSVFETSLNVRVGDTLLHIGPQSKGLSCLGVALDDGDVAELVSQARPGDIAVASNEVLRIYTRSGVASISARMLKPMSTALSPFAGTLDIELLGEQLEQLDLVSKLGIALDERFLRTCSTLARDDASADELDGCVAYLIGRGLGLTPSGDDVLVGYGVGRHLTGRAHPFVDVLEARLSTASTTDVSLAYLRAISCGHANLAYIDLAEAAAAHDSERVAHALGILLKVGHTSGADGLFGFALGIGLNLLASRPAVA